jgi:type II secretory pathway pseudopilin PulG
MIEVLLALGVIAIGAVSVMALFPYGFASSRDSVAESFAGDSADQFLHWFAAQTRTNWAGYAGDTTQLPSTKPPPPLPPPTGTGFETDSGAWEASSTTITPNLLYRKHGSDAGVLKVTFQRGDAPPIVDFSGVYRIWREAVTVPYLTATGASGETTLATDVAVAINLEASWPAELPYQRRQKAVYRLEVFKP